MDARLLDVLHDAAEVELGPVVERVDIDLDRVVEEPVDQHRLAWAGALVLIVLIVLAVSLVRYVTSRGVLKGNS